MLTLEEIKRIFQGRKVWKKGNDLYVLMRENTIDELFAIVARGTVVRGLASQYEVHPLHPNESPPEDAEEI